MNDPTLDFVTLQIEAPPETGSFIIGVNYVGEPLTEAGVTVEWHDLTEPATQIRINRGGATSGVLVVLDVGMATATFVNLDIDASIAPNRPFRVLSKDDGTPLFTGRVLDLSSTDDKDGNTFTTLVSVDPVQPTGNTKVSQVISPDGWESWAARIARLCALSTVPTNAPGA